MAFGLPSSEVKARQTQTEIAPPRTYAAYPSLVTKLRPYSPMRPLRVPMAPSGLVISVSGPVLMVGYTVILCIPHYNY